MNMMPFQDKIAGLVDEDITVDLFPFYINKAVDSLHKGLSEADEV